MQNDATMSKGLYFIAVILLSFTMISDVYAEETAPTDKHPIRSFFARLFSTDKHEMTNNESETSDSDSNDSSNSTPIKTADVSRQAHLLAKKADGIDEKVLALALKAHACALQKRQVKNDDILTVIDYSRPSTEERLWVFDLNRNKALFNTLVAHGKNSGEKFATRFSDHPGSAQSSLGGFTTGRTYVGGHGRSLELIGHEPGFNAHALSRRIVIHGADYATEAFADARGFLGRSFGCPAIAGSLVQPIISKIQNGSFVFAYYPDKTWLKKSKYLHCEA
jgi:hypothetical protein